MYIAAKYEHRIDKKSPWKLWSEDVFHIKNAQTLFEAKTFFNNYLKRSWGIGNFRNVSIRKATLEEVRRESGYAETI